MVLKPILIDEMDINNFNGGSVSDGVWSGYRAPGGTTTYSYNSTWLYEQNRDYVIEVKFNTNDTSYFSTLDLGIFIIHWHRDNADYVGILDGGSYKTFTADTKGDKIYKFILKRNKSYEIYINDVLFKSGSVTNLPANGHKSIVCSINYGYARIDYIRINEIKNDKYLFQDGTEIKKYESGSGWVSVGTAPATKAMFDQYGMTDLSIIDNNAIQQLTSDTPELLCWTDEEGDSVIRQANITAVPLPQLLLPVGDIEVGEIESVNINSVVIGRINDTNNIAPYLTSYDNNIIYGSHANAYLMFDRNINSKFSYSSAIGMKVNIKLNQPEIIKKIAIIAGTFTNSAPKAFKIYGSNNPQNFSDVNNQNGWILLANITSQIGWTINERREFVLNNINAYQYVRFEFYQSNNSDNGYEIAEIELFPASKGNSDLKIFISGDSGVNWKGKNGITVDISDLTQVKANGFTPDELNALTKQELASLFPNGKARFAFYLEQEKSTDIVQIDSLKINEKVYTMIPSIESLKVIYNLLESEKPKLYVSRDDGVTWKEVQPDTLTSLEDLPEGNKLRVKAVLSNGQELHALSYSWI